MFGRRAELQATIPRELELVDPADTAAIVDLKFRLGQIREQHLADVPGAIERSYVVGLHTSLSRLGPALHGAPVPWDWEEFEESKAAYHQKGFA